MSTLQVSIQSLSKSYGIHDLFSGISLGIFDDERIGLIGPNGSGKSTLLKLLAGLEKPDEGKVIPKGGVHIVYLPQNDILDPQKTIREILEEVLPDGLEYAEQDPSFRKAQRLLDFQDFDQKIGTLSGGWHKRVTIVRALLQKPDILLMDEPTNHLDLDGILWLESFLKQASFAFVLVSHDRFFLENTTNRIIELNRRYPEGFLKVEGNYSLFLDQRDTFIDEQNQQEQVLANKVRREVEWLQRGPKARTTKSQSRIDSAHQLQGELSSVKNRNSQNRAVQIDFEGTERKTKILMEAKAISFARGEQKFFEKLNFQLTPGKCLGILGRNGSGKSTLMQLITGELTPDSGEVTHATGARIVVFDQKREQLNPNQTLKQALGPAGDSVIFQGRPIHIVTWAKRFLFPSEYLGMPVSQLSGGEQARVLIANLMLQPADILLLDEPTNDLDIPTLEVLEDSLREFAGAIVLVTHDRFLMDRLSSNVLYLDGSGKTEHFEDYAQWLQAYRSTKSPSQSSESNKDDSSSQKKPKRLSYEEQKELNKINKKIEKSEELLITLQNQFQDHQVVSNGKRLQELTLQIEDLKKGIAELYQRWEILESLKE